MTTPAHVATARSRCNVRVTGSNAVLSHETRCVYQIRRLANLSGKAKQRRSDHPRETHK